MFLLRHVLRQIVILSSLAIASVAGIIAIQSQSLQRLLQELEKPPSEEHLQQTLKLRQTALTLKRYMPSLGFNNLVANQVFLQFLEYFGDLEARLITGYELSPEYFEVILEHDPYFLEAYFFLSTSTSIYAGLPEKTVELLSEKLVTLSPTLPRGSYYIWRYKGADELLFLGDEQAARESFTMAGDWALADGSPEALKIAELSHQTAQFLAQDSASIAARIRVWETVLLDSIDEAVRQFAIQEIEALGGQVLVDETGDDQVILPENLLEHGDDNFANP